MFVSINQKINVIKFSDNKKNVEFGKTKEEKEELYGVKKSINKC